MKNKGIREALNIEYAVTKERLRCLKAIDDLKEQCKERLTKEMSHKAIMILNMAKNEIGT